MVLFGAHVEEMGVHCDDTAYTPGCDIGTNSTPHLQPNTHGLLAQSVERWSNKPTVESSNLSESTNFKSHGLAVEHFINTEKIRVRLSVRLLFCKFN